ncbi:MAG: SAM-dependent methyltransferase [Acidimicrobiales bacterium]
MTAVEELVRGAIERRGPIPFDEVMALALYHPEHGFYSGSGQAGRQGDFLTSPEVGPLFGAVVARALDTWWEDAGEPEVFTVVEAGAGPGTLARSILAAEPACAAALRYILDEVSERQRARHATHQALDPPAFAYASLPDLEAEVASVTVANGPIVVSLPDLPRAAGPCVVLANELLDNLPVGLRERTQDGWDEVRVGVARDGALREVVVAGTSTSGPDVPLGGRAPNAQAAAGWVRDAVALAGPGGRVVAFDYVSTTGELAQRPWTEWLRTYRQHERGGHPLEHLGSQDITCEVPVDQLPPPAREVSQAEWLREHGIDQLVEEGRATWRERAAIGDLAAVRARSRVTEAEALLDPSGLGAFRVLEWEGG